MLDICVCFHPWLHVSYNLKMHLQARTRPCTSWNKIRKIWVTNICCKVLPLNWEMLMRVLRMTLWQRAAFWSMFVLKAEVWKNLKATFWYPWRKANSGLWGWEWVMLHQINWWFWRWSINLTSHFTCRCQYIGNPFILVRFLLSKWHDNGKILIPCCFQKLPAAGAMETRKSLRFLTASYQLLQQTVTSLILGHLCFFFAFSQGDFSPEMAKSQCFNEGTFFAMCGRDV